MAGGGAGPVPSAAVVGVGDELLYGTTVDTNGAWLGRALSELGFSLPRRVAVGDVGPEIAAALASALEVAEVVLVTGGLGPTPDDLTREAVAEALHRSLGVDPGVLQTLEDRFRARGYAQLPANALAMAMVPEGALVLPNPRGAAPGLVLEAAEAKTVILLPGVPSEMMDLFRTGVAPFLAKRFRARLRPVAHRLIHTTGIPESLLAREVARLFPAGMGSVALAYLPDLHGVRLRLTTRAAPGTPEVEAELDRIEGTLAPLLASHRYLSGSGDLAETVGRALLSVGATLAVAESCTGGLVARRVTEMPGASRYFVGGVVAYDNQVKVDLLGVEPMLLAERGAVCAEVAEALALGVADRLGARAGLGVTGVAGPTGGTPEKPVGTVWYAASLDGTVRAEGSRFSGSRGDVRERAAQAALHLLLRVVEDHGR